MTTPNTSGSNDLATRTDTQDATTRPAHTPGPLTLHIGQDGGMFARAKSGRLIAGFQTSTLNVQMPEGEGEANAQLFIAAGDMLAAMKAAKAIKEGAALKSTSFKLEALIEIGKLLDAAIAKAGGQ